jgi:translation initiation factor IF-3
VNQFIRAAEVRVIDSDGTQVGVVPLREALKIAETRGLDLVEVAPNAKPPVCRVINFDKFRYAAKKKAHDQRKHTASGVKEVKMGARTAPHDVDFKVKHIRRFIDEGQRVKVSISFRGREVTRPELGRNLLERILAQVTDVSQAEGSARMEGRNMSVLLTPR